MKKTFGVTLIIIMIIFFAACGSNNVYMVPDNSEIVSESGSSNDVSKGESEELPTQTNISVAEQLSADEVAPVSHISGSAQKKGLRFSIDQDVDSTIAIKIENDTDSTFTLGWVDASDVILKTTNGNYSYQLNDYKATTFYIEPYNKYAIECYFDNIEGDFEKLIIKDIHQKDAPLNGFDVEIPIEVNANQNTAVVTSTEPVTWVSGSAQKKGLTFSIDQEAQSTITIIIVNDTESAFTLGWVDASDVILKTTNRNYSYQLNDYKATTFSIEPYKEYMIECYFDNVEGDFENLILKDIRKEDNPLYGFDVEIPLSISVK